MRAGSGPTPSMLLAKMESHRNERDPEAVQKWDCMKEVEVNRRKENHILYISDSPFFLDVTLVISSSVDENLDLSWVSNLKMQAKTSNPAKLNADSDQEQEIKKLEKELLKQKILVENLKRNMAEHKEEFRAREEAQARRYDALEATMKDMMGMMKKQAKP